MPGISYMTVGPVQGFALGAVKITVRSNPNEIMVNVYSMETRDAEAVDVEKFCLEVFRHSAGSGLDTLVLGPGISFSRLGKRILRGDLVAGLLVPSEPKSRPVPITFTVENKTLDLVHNDTIIGPKEWASAMNVGQVHLELSKDRGFYLRMDPDRPIDKQDRLTIRPLEFGHTYLIPRSDLDEHPQYCYGMSYVKNVLDGV
jgi:hypothetical protein